MNLVNPDGTPVHLEPDLRIDTVNRDADGVRVHDDARHAESLDEMVEVSVSDRLHAGPIGGGRRGWHVRKARRNRRRRSGGAS
jgi:hypothetical protein